MVNAGERRANVSSAESSVHARVRMQPSERRELLLDAASAEFLSRGYGATSMRDIAARAGVAVGLIYRHFPNKYEMLMALSAERGPSSLLKLFDESWEHLSLPELIEFALRRLVQEFLDSRETFLVMESQRVTEPDVAEILARLRRQGVEAFAAFLRGWSAQGQIRSGSETVLASSLITLCEAFVLGSTPPPEHVAPSPDAIDEFVRETAAFLLDGCAVHPARG
jgi:AcrR family transcriptional regulator